MYESNGNERVLVTLPMYHAFATLITISSFLVKNTLVVSRDVSVSGLVDAVKRFQVGKTCKSCVFMELVTGSLERPTGFVCSLRATVYCEAVERRFGEQ